MNVRFLIDQLVRLQAGLLAEIATSGGARAPLAQLSDQTFFRLTEELDQRGVGRKISSDMFGMALRAYQKKIQRLAKSSTENGLSLWQAAVEYLDKEGPVTRSEILQRFCRDDEGQLRGVLFDLTESGLATCTGAGPQAKYELVALESGRLASVEHFSDLLWLTIFRDGPIEREAFLAQTSHPQDRCDAALAHLVETGRINAVENDGTITYESTKFELPVDEEGGWEAAILDHYQALVRTVVGVLPGLTGRGESTSTTGGYTYSLDVWPGHPHQDEVLSTLAKHRNELSDLRKRVDAYNETTVPPETRTEVRIYGGQSSAERHKPRTSSPPPAAPPRPDEA